MKIDARFSAFSPAWPAPGAATLPDPLEKAPQSHALLKFAHDRPDKGLNGGSHLVLETDTTGRTKVTGTLPWAGISQL